MDVAELSPPLRECLDAIYRLGREAPPVGLASLARRLGVDAAAAEGRGGGAREARRLVRVDRAGRIALTAEAERIALGLLRKHRLLERFLTDRLELPWARVHDEACRLTPV